MSCNIICLVVIFSLLIFIYWIHQ